MVETHGENLTMANVSGFQVKENVSIRNGLSTHLEQHSKNNAQVILIFDDIEDFRGIDPWLISIFHCFTVTTTSLTTSTTTTSAVRCPIIDEKNLPSKIQANHKLNDSSLFDVGFTLE